MDLMHEREQSCKGGAYTGNRFGIPSEFMISGCRRIVHLPEADTARSLEFRPTINVFLKGHVKDAPCLGGGYVFKARFGYGDMQQNVNKG